MRCNDKNEPLCIHHRKEQHLMALKSLGTFSLELFLVSIFMHSKFYKHHILNYMVNCETE